MKISKLIVVIIATLWFTVESCSTYTVTTATRTPADEMYFNKRVIASYFWSTLNVPPRLVDSCYGNNTGYSDLRITTNWGYSLLHVVSLGSVSLLKVQWICQKPCPEIGR
jgi:hypothetical protein